MYRGKRVLFIAPHTDDVELGCGATMARLIEEEIDIFVAAFSTAEESLPDGVEPGTLKREFMNAACKVLSIPEERLYIYDYPVRRLSYHRQEVLEDLVKLKKNIEPDIVFTPSGNDLHQDHQVLYNEALRAFKDKTLFGYELPWNHIEFSAQAFVVLREYHIRKKWEALQQYKTQLEMKRPYFSYEFVESLARIRGIQVKENYAEAFEIIRTKI